MKLDFVLGHMGGNRVVLLHGAQIPPGRELELALKALGPDLLWAHEAGILYPGIGAAGLHVKIAEPIAGRFISACGGLTQVLGKALVESGLGGQYHLEIKEPSTRVLLDTVAGRFEVNIAVTGGKAGRVTSVMDAFVRDCYRRGVGTIELRGVPAVRVGSLLVLNGDSVRERYPRADFAGWDTETGRLVAGLQQEFMERTGITEYNLCLYDWHPVHGGDVRALFPHYIPRHYIEPSCGTGSIAVGIAMLETGEFLQQKGPLESQVNLKLETGGGFALGGPDITDVSLELEVGGLKGARFSHSLVEIAAVGEIRV